MGFGWRGGVRGLALAAAVSITALWGLVDLVFALTQDSAFYETGAAIDVIRMGAWYAFLLLLAQSATAGTPDAALRRPNWFIPLAAALVVIGVGAQLAVAMRLAFPADALRLSLFDGIALNVFGLVLVEQVRRNQGQSAGTSPQRGLVRSPQAKVAQSR